MGRVAFASFIGTAIEFYDFCIYGTAAALAFATVFVPEGPAGRRVADGEGRVRRRVPDLGHGAPAVGIIGGVGGWRGADLRQPGRGSEPTPADGVAHAGVRIATGRYPGASVGYNLGGVLGGAFAPMLASFLLIVAGGSWAISLYIALTAGPSLLCGFFLSETHLADVPARREERDVLADGGVVPE